MGRTSIGDLVVKITADADHFDSMMTKSEKRLAAFAAKAANPFTKVAAGLGSIPDLISTPFNTILNPINAIAPGLMTAIGVTGGFTQSMESAANAMERVRDISREAQRYGVSPKFFRAFQLVGGPDGDIAGKVLDKLLDAQSSLRDGNKALAESLRSPHFDPEKFAWAALPDAVKQAADAYSKFKDQNSAAKFLGGITSEKMADDAHYFFSGGGRAIRTAEEKVNTMHLASDEVISAATNLGRMSREVKLMEESNAQRRAVAYAPWSVGFSELGRGNLGRGTKDLLQGGWQLVNEWTMGWFKDNDQAFKQYGEWISDRFPGAAATQVGDETDPYKKRQQALYGEAQKMLNQLENDRRYLGSDPLAQRIQELADRGLPKVLLDKLNDSAAGMKSDTAAIAIRKANDELGFTIRTWGRAAEEIAYLRAIQEGATEKEARRREGIVADIEVLKIADMAKTSAVRAFEELSLLQERVAKGKLSAETGAIRSSQILNQAFGIDAMRKRSSGGVPLIEAGSQQHYALLDALQGKAEEEQIKVSADQIIAAIDAERRQQEKDAKQTHDLLRDIEKKRPGLIRIPP